MSAAMVVSGSGRYADPWHPFVRTSTRLAALVHARGVAVEVRDDVDEALAGLPADPVDLVVINVGNPAGGMPDPAAAEGIRAHVERGGRVLAVHSALTTWSAWGDWEEIIGGRWDRGTTFHPPAAPSTIRVRSGASETEFDVTDELYTLLRVAPDADVVASHRFDGAQHALAWVSAGGTAAATALGHESSAYDGRGVRRVVDLLLDRLLT